MTYHQTRALSARVPDMPNLDNSELSELVDIVSAINEGRMSTKAAKFHMLIIAATKPAFKPNVFEGIADL